MSDFTPIQPVAWGGQYPGEHHFLEALAVPDWAPRFFDRAGVECSQDQAVRWEQEFIRDMAYVQVVRGHSGLTWPSIGTVVLQRPPPPKIPVYCACVWELGRYVHGGSDVVHPLLKKASLIHNGWRFSEEDGLTGRRIEASQKGFTYQITGREASWRETGDLVEKAPGAALFDAAVAFHNKVHDQGNKLSVLTMFRDAFGEALKQFAKDGDTDLLIRTMQELDAEVPR